MGRLHEGDTAPDFTLPSEGGPKGLADLRGSWVVLYFYPRDFTAGCTQEACDFRDAFGDEAMDAVVLGVSPDDVDSHEKFRQAHGLHFPLLSDEDKTVAQAYGAFGEKTSFGKKTQGIIRSTFLIDPQGTVAKAYYGVKSAGHAAEVAEDLRALQG